MVVNDRWAEPGGNLGAVSTEHPTSKKFLCVCVCGGGMSPPCVALATLYLLSLLPSLESKYSTDPQHPNPHRACPVAALSWSLLTTLHMAPTHPDPNQGTFPKVLPFLREIWWEMWKELKCHLHIYIYFFNYILYYILLYII